MSKRQSYSRKSKEKLILQVIAMVFVLIVAGLGYLIQHKTDDITMVPEIVQENVVTITPTKELENSELTSAPEELEVTKEPIIEEESIVTEEIAATKEPVATQIPSNNRVSNLTVHFIDVGQADSILIESDGEFMLVDAGNNADKNTVINYLKDQGVEKLKYIVATHPHEDHIGAMDEVIEAFPVGKVFAPYVEHTSKTYYNLLEAVTLANLKMKQPKVGSEVMLGGSTVTFLSPNSDYGDDLNNWSVGLKVTNGVHTFVMCGDAENQAESDILANGIDLKADVLKLGHHGSSTSSSDAFLKTVDPEFAVISCGVDNSYGHPHIETLEKINKLGIKLFRTDQQGTIVATSNGKKLTWNVKACN